MNNFFKYIACISILFTAYGCIKNDIPYPRIQANFTSFEVEDQKGETVIDTESRTITINLTEEANIKNVKVKGYSLSEDSHLIGEDSIISLDLSQPVNVTLGLYQDYQWTIIGKQDIERYFVVTGEIGSSVIDVPNHRVIFTFPDNLDVSRVYIERMKLGQTVSITSPNLEGTYVDFSSSISVDGANFGSTKGVEVDVTTFGETVTWHIYASITDVTVFTTSVYAWTNVAWANGEAEAGKDNGFEYRLADVEEWTKVPSDWVTFNGGEMEARIIHLQPETEYVVRAYSDDQYGLPLTFTTQNVAQMPNSSFNDWTLNGKVWQPWGEGQQQYWDTGNKGATIFGTSNVVPTTDTSTGDGQAALLKTEFKGLGGTIGKIAAGSIYAGYFVRADGTNGILSFGRPFNQRPTKLTGYFKYKTAPITDTQSQFNYMMGRPDTCIVWIALVDSEEPFEIRTNPNNLHLFNPEGSEVIAYGSMQSGQDINSYTRFEITLDYKSKSRIPNYIICVASSSKYGDYFTGGRGAELYLDNLELHYDY